MVAPKMFYYILDGSVYQTPTIHAVFSARLVSIPLEQAEQATQLFIACAIQDVANTCTQPAAVSTVCNHISCVLLIWHCRTGACTMFGVLS